MYVCKQFQIHNSSVVTCSFRYPDCSILTNRFNNFILTTIICSACFSIPLFYIVILIINKPVRASIHARSEYKNGNGENGLIDL